MTFFGEFLDGPLAGTTFEGTTDSGGGDSIGPIVTLAFWAGIFAVIFCLIVGPLVVWPLLFESEIREGRSIIGGVCLLAIQIIYVALRIRTCVRHWNVNFFKELFFNGLFLAVIVLGGLIILPLPLSHIYLSEAEATYLTEHYGEFIMDVLSGSSPILYIFFFYCLSVIPAGVTTLLSKVLCRQALNRKKNSR